MRHKQIIIVMVVLAAGAAGFLLGWAVCSRPGQRNDQARVYGIQLYGYRDEGNSGVYCINISGTNAVRYVVRRIADGKSETLSTKRVERDSDSEDLMMACRVDRDDANSQVFNWMCLWKGGDSMTKIPIPRGKRIITSPMMVTSSMKHLPNGEIVYKLYMVDKDTGPDELTGSAMLEKQLSALEKLTAERRVECITISVRDVAQETK